MMHSRRSSIRLAIFLTTGSALAAAFALSVIRSEAQEPATATEAELKRDDPESYRDRIATEGFARAIRRLELDTPVGALMPYAGSGDASLTKRGWLLCDGSKFDVAKYPELHAVLGSDTLPDFRGRVAQGRTEKQTLLAAEGGQTEQSATASAGNHTHTLPAWTGLMGIIPAGPPRDKKYSVEDDGVGWTDNRRGDRARHIEVGGGDNAEGQHRHELGGNTGGGGNHAHSIPPLNVNPRHIAVNYIIKAQSFLAQDAIED